MIKVNDELIEFTSFPDGTTSFRFDPRGYVNPVISWFYDGDHECILLWHLVHHLRACNPGCCVSLFMPYIPNARMDRVKEDDEVFTLKWFAEFINSLKFERVFVLDPHSSVSTALLDRVQALGSTVWVKLTELEYLEKQGISNILYCYPDEGAAKRYSDNLNSEYVFCVKHRDWRTGDIEHLELTSPEKVAGRNVLIVDDICSRGGTFTHTAKALREAGADKVFLFVTHCEDNIYNGDVLTDGLIDHVFTMGSILRNTSSENITVFDVDFFKQVKELL